jgi:tRNA(His) guanylyltransferase
MPQATHDDKYELVEPGTTPKGDNGEELDSGVSQGSKTQVENDKKKRAKARIIMQHTDIIKDGFWEKRPWLLSNRPGKIPKEI